MVYLGYVHQFSQTGQFMKIRNVQLTVHEAGKVKIKVLAEAALDEVEPLVDGILHEALH